MAAYHARSNSFPSKQHPLVSEFDQQLSRLRSSQEASSSTSIACKLSGLQDLHDCVDQLLLLPLNQQSLRNEQNEKRFDELFDGSLRILDVCSTAKDALMEIKQSTQELQSIFRRRRSGEFDLTSEVKKISASRKMVKKTIQKAILENRCSFNRINKDEKSDEIVSMLREVESISLAVLESLFSFITGPKSQKSNSWSLVSKLMNSNRVVCEEVNEFETSVIALQSLICHKTKNSDILLVENAQNELQKLQMSIQDLEEGVEGLYRRMIKTRVSLLNILNQ